MIFANRTITVNNGKSKINEPIVAYRGDYELEVRFTILNSTFNFIETENAAFGQLAVLTPYGGNIFSSVAECNEGAVSFLLSKDMLDQIEEVGLYSFQIRLFDQDKQSRISIPPVEHGIEIREPIASEDHDNTVNNAIVGYSIARVVNPKEGIIGDTFDEHGNYNKTKWKTGDRISEVKLNKIEDAIDKINDNEIDNVEALNKRITNNFNVLNSTKADILDVNHKVWGMSNMGQDVKEAMTGGSVAVVGVNTVLNENIVDGQITHRKFAKSFLYSDVKIEPNTDHSTINTLLPTGYMYVLAGSHGMPVDISDRTCLLENITCEDRFVYQKIHEYSNPNKYYVRFFDNSTGNYSEWSYFNMDNVLLDLDVEAKQNLLDKRLFVIGGLTLEGTVGPTVTDNYCSGYIPVYPNKKYYRRIANLVVVAFYDEDKNFIDRPTIQQGAVIIPPQNAYYMRYTDEKEAMNGEVISEFPISKYIEYQPNITYYIKGCTTTPEPRSVDHNKLADNYLSSNNFLANSFDLNTLSSDGIFVCNDVINRPKEITGSSFLINKGFKLADNSGGVRWVLQEIFDYFDINKHFYRKVDLESPEHSTNWINANEILDGQITHQKLADNYLSSNNFLANSFDLNTLSSDGIFVCNDVINRPKEITGSSFLINKGFKTENSEGVRWVLQEIFDYFDINKHFYRKVDLEKPEQSTNWINANESAYTSKFKGKKLVTFGDSITEGVGASNSSKNYPSLLSSKYGLIVENKGISGATWAKYNDGYDDISVLTQISNTNFSDVDYVTIFAGTNDFGRGAKPIGDNDDAVENTMKGAINLAIKQIIQAKPTIRIAIITPMWRQRLASGDNKDSDFNTFQGKYLKEYVNAVKEMADYNHIPCLDFYHNCLINKYNYQTFLNDGLHPNDTGYELLADMIHAFLEKTY